MLLGILGVGMKKELEVKGRLARLQFCVTGKQEGRRDREQLAGGATSSVHGNNDATTQTAGWIGRIARQNYR